MPNISHWLEKGKSSAVGHSLLRSILQIYMLNF